MEVLEEILRQTVHTNVRKLMATPDWVDFKGRNDIFLYPYYKLACKLDRIKL